MFEALCGETMFTDQTYHRCLFLGEVIATPLAKPLIVVLMTRLQSHRRQVMRLAGCVLHFEPSC